MPSPAAALPLLSKFSNVATRLLPGVSKTGLYFVGLLVLVNLNSFPFTWHCESSPPRSIDKLFLDLFYDADKIFRHVWSIRIRFLLYRLALFGKSRETRKELESAWLEKLVPIGSGTVPLRLRVPKKMFPTHLI